MVNLRRPELEGGNVWLVRLPALEAHAKGSSGDRCAAGTKSADQICRGIAEMRCLQREVKAQ
jgi:hypothetical protein